MAGAPTKRFVGENRVNSGNPYLREQRAIPSQALVVLTPREGVETRVVSTNDNRPHERPAPHA